MFTSADWSLGFVMSTNVSKNDPVAPSARNHCGDGRFTPPESWPPIQSGDRPKYIARSAAPGACKNSTTLPNDELTISGIEPQSSVVRENGGSVRVMMSGGTPFSRRNVILASVEIAF